MSKIQEFVDPNIVKNLGQELLNALGTDLKTAETSLYERKTLNFRDVIDNNFPTILIIDYDNIEKELKLYNDLETSLKTYISNTYKPTEKDYSVNKLSEKEIQLVLKTIKRGMSLVPAVPIPYQELQKRLQGIVSANISSNTILSNIKNLFSRVYRLTGVSSSQTDILVFPKFSNVSSYLKKYLDTAVQTYAASEQTQVHNVSDLLAYGHTAAGYVNSEGNAVLKFNSPKLMAIMFDVINSSSNKSDKSPEIEALSAATFFVNDTRQTEVFITVDKQFSDDFLNLFISIGGNIVRYENSLINSRRGTVLEKTEKRGVNKVVLEKLAKKFQDTQTALGSRLFRYIVNKKSSPNVVEYISHVIISGLDGKKPVKYTGSSKESKVSSDKLSKKVVSGLAKSKAKLTKLSYKPTQIPRKSPVNLETLINSQLFDTIKSNMGTGNRTDVLNYRTGRFAQSVKLERISESRQGMITAFYSYMKNPYATFSSGGRQEYPKSRDPKLLISKSIREIAQTLVSNRLRAVNV